MTEPVRQAVDFDPGTLDRPGATLRVGGHVIGRVTSWTPQAAKGQIVDVGYDAVWQDVRGAAPSNFKVTIPIGQMKMNLGFMYDRARAAGQPFEPGEWWKMCTCPGGHVCRHCGERTRSWCNVVNTCPHCGCPNGYETAACMWTGAPGMPDDRYGNATRLSQGAKRAGDLEHVFGAAVEWVCRFPFEQGEDRRLTRGWEEDLDLPFDEYAEAPAFLGGVMVGYQIGDIGP